MTRRLLGILGRRTLLGFSLVSFLAGALLAAVNITSRHALKAYVEDQLARIPWDVAVYHQGALAGDRTLHAYVAANPDVTRVESLAFLRARFPETGEVEAQVDGKPFVTPWLCLMAASDASILPPALGHALARGASSSLGGRGAVLALVGPEFSIGRSLHTLQGAREFSLRVHFENQPRHVFSTPIREVMRLDRAELNSWLMDQTGSPSFIPYIAAVLLMPFDWDVLTRYDTVASGFVPPEVLAPGQDVAHIALAEYAPELVYLARVDRTRLVSGWDLSSSLARVRALAARLRHGAVDSAPAAADAVDPDQPHAHAGGEADDHGEKFGGPTRFVVDSVTEVLLQRMRGTARQIGVVSLLAALPLLWTAWVLAANLAGLLMLNERRTIGLMRLRGVPGEMIGRALLLAVVAGGGGGGLLGLAAGSVLPLLALEGRIPAGVLGEPRQVAMYVVFLLVSVGIALFAGRRLVLYALSISPLEASARVSESEAAKAALRFGLLQGLALALGAYVLAGWLTGVSLSSRATWLGGVDRLLGFLGLPLFLYGLATLLASRRDRIQRAMQPLLVPIGGVLGGLALQHAARKPHRTMAFLLIVALMSSVSLYPIVTIGSFEDRARRGARVQVGLDWQVFYNAPDLLSGEPLSGGAERQLAALKPRIEDLLVSLRRIDGVKATAHAIEAVLPAFFLPGYGLRGVPLYLLGGGDAYRAAAYSEPSLGVSQPYQELLARTRQGEIAVSPPVADFWRLRPGSQMLLGKDAAGRAVSARAAGVLAFLPGLPPRAVGDRQGYVQARVDYLNQLFGANAYLVAGADELRLGSLQLLVPRIVVLIGSAPGVDPVAFERALQQATPFPPLEIRSLGAETARIGSDMYVSLALANMRTYLIGGLVLALVAILSIAVANYTEDRRTLGLLRVRGASPRAIWRFSAATLITPALLGLLLGAASALVAGFGLASHVWRVRELRSVVQLLPTRLVVPELGAWVLLLFVALLVGLASGFSWWVFRRTARESLQER